MNQPGMEYNEAELVVDEEEQDFFSMFEQDEWMEGVGGDEPDSVKRWKDVEPTSKNVRVTIGETQEDTWKQARMEIEDVRTMMKRKLGTKHPSIQQCASLVYNEDGPIYKLFQEKLGWNYAFFRKFLATIAFQNAMNLSSTTLYSPNAGRISKYQLMDKEEFDDIWNKIGKLGLPRKGKAVNSVGVGEVYFWKELQDAFNKLYRELFVQKPSAFPSVTPAVDISESEVEKSEVEVEVDDDVDLRDSMEKLVIDDFKVYFVSGNKEKAGLRISQHTRKNRKGPVMHQVVKTASGVIVGFHFEQEGDSEKTATTKLLKGQLASMVGGDFDHVVGLEGFEIGGDRAYNKKAVVEILLRSGVQLNGTKAMTLDNPFVYGKKVKETDPRTELDKEGAMTLWIKHRRIEDRDVYIHAYRNGYGGIVTGITTKFPDFEWEFILKNPGDLEWYEKHCRLVREEEDDEAAESIFRKSFPPVKHAVKFKKTATTTTEKIKPLSSSFILLLSDSGVHPVTIAQGSQDWFFLRAFSCTSRTVHSMLQVVLKNDNDKVVESLDGFEEIDTDEHLEYIQMLRLYLGKGPSDALTTAVASTTSNATGSVAAVPPVSATQDTMETSAAFSQEHFFDPLTNTEDYLSNFEMNREFLVDLAVNIGMDSTKTERSKVDKRLRDWLDVPFQMRIAYFDKDALQTKYSTLPDEYKRESSKALTITQLRKTLASYYNNLVDEGDDTEIIQRSSKPHAKRGRKKKDTTFEDLPFEYQLTSTMLQSTFMRRLEGKGKIYAAKGSANEEPIALKTFLLLRKGAGGEEFAHIQFLEIAHAPLVSLNGGFSADRLYECIRFMIKASADFVCYCKILGQMDSDSDSSTSSSSSSSSCRSGPSWNECLIGMEVKTRVTIKSEERERVKRGLANLNRRRKRGERHKKNKIFHILDWNDLELKNFVSHDSELLQILHCATVYNCSAWMLTIGNTKVNLIACILVRFPRNIRTAWYRLVCYMGWAALVPVMNYSQNQSSNAQIELLKETASTVKLNRSAVLDLYSLKQFWNLYKSCAETLVFPLPPCVRLIPKMFGYWNANKSGSDTRSKLMSHAEYKPSSKLIQSDVVCLIISEGYTTIHRLYQIATSKKDLSEKYSSLRHYRNAANRQSSYKNTLMVLSNHLSGWNCDGTSSLTNDTDFIIPTTSPSPMVTRAQLRNSYIDVEIGEKVTGKTPKQGILQYYENIQKKSPTRRTEIEKYLHERKKKCRGPCFRVDQATTLYEKQKDPSNDKIINWRGTYVLCKKPNASYYCAGCHSFYHKYNTIDKDLKKVLRMKLPNSDRVVYAELDCYSFCHPILFGNLEAFGSYEPAAKTKPVTRRAKRSSSAPPQQNRTSTGGARSAAATRSSTGGTTSICSSTTGTRIRSASNGRATHSSAGGTRSSKKARKK